GGRPSPRDRTRGQDNVERPRTDETGTSAEGREQPVVEPQVETTPAPVADAPDSTTPATKHDEPQKLDKSGDESAEKTRRCSFRARRSSASTSVAAGPATRRTRRRSSAATSGCRRSRTAGSRTG